MNDSDSNDDLYAPPSGSKSSIKSSTKKPVSSKSTTVDDEPPADSQVSEMHDELEPSDTDLPDRFTSPVPILKPKPKPKKKASTKDDGTTSEDDADDEMVSRPAVKKKQIVLSSQPTPRPKIANTLHIQPVASGSKRTSMLPPASQRNPRIASVSAPSIKPRATPLSQSQSASETPQKKRKRLPGETPSSSVAGLTSSESQAAIAQVEAMLTSSPNGDQDDDEPNDTELEMLSPADELPPPPKKRAKLAPPSSSQPVSSLSRSTPQGSLTTMPAKSRGKKHSKFWALDGSVVVQLHKILFRLVRSQLVRHSTFFAAILGEPETYPGGLQKLYAKATRLADMDDKPVLKIRDLDISVQDFETLVEFMDDPYVYLDSPLPFPVLAGLLRASRALEFSRFNDIATRKLQQLWPYQLEKLTVDPKDHASETIVLARQWDMPELLKRAFYELVRTTSLGQELFEDEEDEDGEGNDSAMNDEERNKTISRADLIRLVMTREKLHLEWLFTADSPPSALEFPCPLAVVDPKAAAVADGPAPSSPSGSKTAAADQCYAARADFSAIWSEKVKQTGVYEDHLYDPICGMDNLALIEWEKAGFCDGCVESWKIVWKKKQEKLWENLELWLKLPEIPQAAPEAA
ncbi:hypothetical protein EUX98_g7080 [Antrodiella citrinella]|uniref:BTB domain-containing protein n=1 Tax=Antrodiella citrinella TaxID=2447956 RepID=A0A4S4MP75_9APHY|nr:hypothetical protein EUX98_g7080 [Antrodiella citrinella]